MTDSGRRYAAVGIGDAMQAVAGGVLVAIMMMATSTTPLDVAYVLLIAFIGIALVLMSQYWR